MIFDFNRNEVLVSDKKIELTEEEIKNTTGLFRASLQDAVLYGGEGIKKALSTIEFQGNREFITVDAKVHMLMPGMIPAIPGWHTDGIPRSENGHPSGEMPPFCPMLEKSDSPFYHLFIAGSCSPTVFLEPRNFKVRVPNKPTNSLYGIVNENLNKIPNLDAYEYDVEEGYWYTWDWFELHKAQPARERGWRLLIRVTESDFLEPNTDLSDVIRTQQQAYLTSENFGW